MFKILSGNHVLMITVKYNLAKMYGRMEGYRADSLTGTYVIVLFSSNKINITVCHGSGGALGHGLDVDQHRDHHSLLQDMYQRFKRLALLIKVYLFTNKIVYSVGPAI